MAKARVSNVSEDFSILGSESQANTVVFPLMREESRGKTKIKWLIRTSPDLDLFTLPLLPYLI